MGEKTKPPPCNMEEAIRTNQAGLILFSSQLIAHAGNGLYDERIRRV